MLTEENQRYLLEILKRSADNYSEHKADVACKLIDENHMTQSFNCDGQVVTQAYVRM